MKTTTKAQIKEWMNSAEDLLVIDVLPEESFAKQHIPDAVNIPIKDNANFVKQVDQRIISPTQRIVVYCASAKCNASEEAAKKLEDAGFGKVYRFVEGLEGWFGPSGSGKEAA